MIKKLIIICVALSLIGQIMAQSRPGWTVKLPKADNNTYIYVCEDAIAGLEKDARNQAIARVLQSTAMRLGVKFDSQKVFESVQSGTDLTVISQQFNIPIYKVCEYTERIGHNYKVYVLCQVAAVGNVPPQFDYSFRGCNDDHRYSTGSALLSSALLPGLGQMGKRHYGEGVATLLGEVALAGCATVTYIFGKQELAKLSSGTLSYAEYTSAKNNYNSLMTVNHVLLWSSAALYAFNLFRAATLHPNYKQTAYIEPLFINTPTETYTAMGLTLRF